MSDNNLFAEHLKKKDEGLSGFLKNPKSWIILVSVVVGTILAAFFYISVILGGMSGEEVKNSIEIVWHDSKWVDKEVTPQEVKIIPTISLKIKNIGQRPLQYMDIEAVFEFEETGAVFSDGMVRILKEPLQPGEISEEILIKSLYGYAGSSRSAFMGNKKEWKKVQAKIYARSKGSGLVRIGKLYPIKQEIEGYKDPETEDSSKKEYQNENTRELAHSIQVVDHDSMWVDKIVTAGEVIIVPSITVDVKNVGQKPLQYIYFKGVFKYEDTGEILSEGLTPGLKKPLAPGETAVEIQIKADFGYAASSKEAFIRNNQKWKRLKVNLYAKSKESDYALLAIYPIKQKIQGVKVIHHFK